MRKKGFDPANGGGGGAGVPCPPPPPCFLYGPASYSNSTLTI